MNFECKLCGSEDLKVILKEDGLVVICQNKDCRYAIKLKGKGLIKWD